jgi:hypothetical protein
LLPGTASCGTAAGRHLKRRLEMLSRKRPSFVLRAAAGTLVAAFFIGAFAPIRLSAFENDGTDHDHGKDYETHGDQVISGKRTPVAYLIKRAGEKGTRGSIHIPADERAVRGLNRANRDAVYFRTGDDRWITHDAETIQEFYRALEPEDRFEESLKPSERRREALERRQGELETRYEGLEARKETLEEKKAELEEAIAEGRSDREIEASRRRLQEEREALQRDLEDLRHARDLLHRQMETLYQSEKRAHQERDRIHAMVLQDIARIGQRAVRQGRAEPYDP